MVKTAPAPTTPDAADFAAAAKNGQKVPRSRAAENGFFREKVSSLLRLDEGLGCDPLRRVPWPIQNTPSHPRNPITLCSMASTRTRRARCTQRWAPAPGRSCRRIRPSSAYVTTPFSQPVLWPLFTPARFSPRPHVSTPAGLLLQGGKSVARKGPTFRVQALRQLWRSFEEMVRDRLFPTAANVTRSDTRLSLTVPQPLRPE